MMTDVNQARPWQGIHIITHCYAVQLPQYAAFLRYQLSSLVLRPPEVPTRITVCYCPDDVLTRNTLLEFQYEHPQMRLQKQPLAAGELFRRSIGRNTVALATPCTLVWFCDVDHVFHEHCLDTLYELWQTHPDKPLLVWPKTIMIQKTHALGDISCRQVTAKTTLIDIDTEQFEPKRYTRAIGGVQIVSGDFCRGYGYLAHSQKYQRPRTDGHPFGDFKDDVVFRQFVSRHGPLRGINLPGLYRLRHSQKTY